MAKDKQFEKEYKQERLLRIAIRKGKRKLKQEVDRYRYKRCPHCGQSISRLGYCDDYDDY